MKASEIYDVIIAGAGSVGTPTAMYMAKAGLKVLVLDPFASPGQGSNKHAIGGIRATHSDPAKIYLCTESLKVFSSWKNQFGDDIEWREGGYCFVAYETEVKTTLISLLESQQKMGLNIRWYEGHEILQYVPNLQTKDLLGGTYSPEDGSASPLKAAYSFYKHAREYGAKFQFFEPVKAIKCSKGKISQVFTNSDQYSCKYFVNAAGSWAASISNMINIELPVQPEAHEAGITEPITPELSPMVVDIRPRVGSSNFYFYQHPTGKIIFCMTPNPQILGNRTLDTSEFLPLASHRLVELMPKLANCRVRRTWRGTYPITPDGSPIVGKISEMEGYLLAAGTCGQGFMLGPGIAILLTQLVLGTNNNEELKCLESLRLDREFSSKEKLK